MKVLMGCPVHHLAIIQLEESDEFSAVVRFDSRPDSMLVHRVGLREGRPSKLPLDIVAVWEFGRDDGGSLVLARDRMFAALREANAFKVAMGLPSCSCGVCASASRISCAGPSRPRG